MAAPLPAIVPPGQPAQPVIASGLTDSDKQAHAREVADFFRKRKDARRSTDLWREMLLVHLDGSGDGQYAVIIDGSYISVPWAFGKKLRVQWNLLQPIVANMVKHHTSIPFRCTVELSGSRKLRKKARAAAAYGNHVIHDQKLNAVVAEALWMAAPYGHCPIHFQWRWDQAHEAYNPVYLTGEEAAKYANVMRRGYTDAYCGDPWNTVYNDGATRTSVHRMTYVRTVPLALVKESFKNVPGIENLKGRRDLPSASRFQQAVRRAWMQAGTGTHGSSALQGGNEGEEIVALLCDELAPGMDSRWPRGRLSIVALDGIASVDDNPHVSDPFHLYTGPLPAGRFSAIRIYSNDSFDDVLGRPFLASLDDLQVTLNQQATLWTERVRRFARTQLLAQSGSLDDDTLLTADDAILYFTGQEPKFLAPPTAEVGTNERLIMLTLDQMFRIGGWQAASRGEGKAGDAAAKVVALANADDSIFASANRFLQEDVCDGLKLACALARENMVVPTPLKTSGTDISYLGEITGDDLPDEPPSYLLTQGSASPEARLQQNLGLVTTKGADGVPLMTTQQFHQSNPDPSLRPVMSEVDKQRRIRPILVADAIEAACEAFVEQQPNLPPEWLPMAAHQIYAAIDREFPIEEGDDPQLNLDALDELILDETVHRLTREVAKLRRGMIAAWQAQMLAYQQMIAAGGQAQMGAMMGGAQPPQRIGSGSPFAGGPTSQEMSNQGGQVEALTAAATS